MIAGWLLYCALVSALLAIAAAAVDSLLTWRGLPARWVWVTVIAATLLVPVVTLVVRERERATPGPVGVSLDVVPPPPVGKPGSVSRIINDIHRPRAPEVSSADRFAVGLALACIALAALRVVTDSLLLYRSRRNWRPENVDGVPVLISDDLGPAIVGLIEPRIVLPRWTLGLDSNERSLVLAHEQEHLRSSDGRLTTAAVFALICMPWSPALWWALRRLRTAIEVDCDRRVLRRFPDIGRYGRLLVDVANRATGSSMAIAGFSERAGPLARRIQAMTQWRGRSRLRDAAATIVAIVCLAASVALLPPTAPALLIRNSKYQSSPAAPKYIADSIARGDSTRVIAAARDLPPWFSVVEYAPSRTGHPAARSCARSLRDDRDDTKLQIWLSSTKTGDAIRRGDTIWLQQTSTGFYHVQPSGRYGVETEQTLRVHCGSSTLITVAGRPIKLSILSSLDGTGDARAFSIAERIQRDMRRQPTAVELYPQRLDVEFRDPLVADVDDRVWDVVQSVFASSREVLGRAAMPETLAVTLRVNRSQWRTFYRYKSMDK